jgi:hypothetical protein
VAGRIEHDTPSSWPRLFIGEARPQRDGLRLGRVQLADADRKIEMNLFRDRAARPGRRLITGYPHGRDRGAFISHHDDIVAFRRHFATEERRPERGETGRVLTIEANQSQASECHDAILAPTPRRRPLRRRGTPGSHGLAGVVRPLVKLVILGHRALHREASGRTMHACAGASRAGDCAPRARVPHAGR